MKMKSVLDSRQLLAARVLADTGSFTLAGQQLFLTQSAVSHAIKSLEAEVECRLFKRSGKGVTLTAAGKHFLEYTDKILAQMATARTLVAPRTTRGKERLRLGVGPRAQEFIMPVVLPAFQREFPNKLVTIEPGNYVQNLELLASGLLDFVFAVKPEGRADFGYVPLYEDELCFVVGRSHPWAKTKRAAKEDIEGNALVLYQKINNIPQLLTDYFESENVSLGHGVEMSDPESIKDLVRSSMAVGVLSPMLLSKELAEGSLVSIPLGRRPLLRQWGLAYQADQPVTLMDRRFIELCRQAVPGILSRLIGQFVLPVKKTEWPAAPALVEGRLKFSGVALLLGSVYNLVDGPIGWRALDSLLLATS